MTKLTRRAAKKRKAGFHKNIAKMKTTGWQRKHKK